MSVSIDEVIAGIDKVTALLMAVNTPIGTISLVAANMIKFVRSLGGPEVDLSLVSAAIRRRLALNDFYETTQIDRLEAEIAAGLE